MVLRTASAAGAGIEDDWDRAIRREQLAILIRQAPFLAAVNVVNALLVGVMVAGQVPAALVWGWTAVIGVGALYPLRTWWRSRLPGFQLSGSHRSIRRAVVQAGIAGAFWALAAPAFAGFLDPQTELFLYIVLAGMVAGGSITLSALPAGALAYSSTIGLVVLAFVFSHDDTAFISLGVMLLLYFFVTGYAARSVFGAAVRALKERAVEVEQRQRVQHQFRDFAAAASDWFWESDKTHRLTEVTGIHAAERQRDSGRFSGLRLHDLAPLTPTGQHDIRSMLAAGARIHNLVCTLRDVTGTPRIVAVNAVPLSDGDGGFLGYRGTFADMSAFVAAQQRADTAEANLQEAIDALDDGLVVYDAEDRVVTYNAKHREMFPSVADVLRPGVRYEEIVRAQIESGQILSAVGREEAAIAERVRQHQNPAAPLIQHFADGRIIRLKELRTSGGGIVALRSDVTDLMQARQRAEVSERSLLTLLETAPIPLWVTTDGRFVFVNRRAHRLLGADDGTLIGERVDRFHEDPEPGGAGAEHEGAERETIVRRADGRRIWVAVSTAEVLYQGNDARITGLLDITELKRAEEQLRESEQRFRDFAASSSDWLWEMGPDLRFTYMSPNIERIVGVPAAWHMGKSRRELLGVDYDQGQWHDHLAAVEAHQPFRDFVYRRAANTSDPRWIRISGVPIFDDAGDFRGYRGVGTDITAQHELQAQLIRAQKLDSVGQLTGGIAHDFNNILGIIIGNLDLLRQQLGDGSEHEPLLQRAIRAGERGGTLTQRLLAFSRRQPLHARVLEVPALLDETGDLLRGTFGQSYPLEIDLPAGLWPAHADAAQLEAAVVNLAINARDASPTGARIAVQARNLPAAEAACLAGVDLAPGDYVAIVVADRGTGMSPSVLERCCEPFFTTKEVGRGAGLGLSMIMGFAKQSGGDLLIESAIGVGTTVTLVLPRAPAPALAKAG